MGMIAIKAQLGSLTPTFMLILSTPLTLCSNFEILARVAKFVLVAFTTEYQECLKVGPFGVHYSVSYTHLTLPTMAVV